MYLNTLFTDNFPDTNNNEELNQLISKYSCYDPDYVVTGSIPERKEKIDRLWQTFAPYADKHFLKQYKHNFSQRLWEMYIGVTFLKNGFKISANDIGPDFLINDTFYLECTMCQNAKSIKSPSFVPEVPKNGSVFSPPSNQVLLRFTSSMSDKVGKIEKQMENGKIKKLPLIIAISTSDISYFEDYFGIPIPIAALFGLGHLQVNQNGDSSFKFMQSISKGEVQINTNHFTNNEYEICNGVLYSNTQVISYPQKIGSDLIYVNNPHAKLPLDFAFQFLRNW